MPDAENSASVVAYMSARQLKRSVENVNVTPWCDRWGPKVVDADEDTAAVG